MLRFDVKKTLSIASIFAKIQVRLSVLIFKHQTKGLEYFILEEEKFPTLWHEAAERSGE